jgi:DNA-binding transcriptional regulator YiaG
MLGVGVTTVNAWETGRDGVQLRYVPAVVKFLGYVPQPSPDRPLGGRLRALRLARGLRQTALGRMLGIGDSIISKLETGGSTTDERVLRAVEGFLKENS